MLKKTIVTRYYNQITINGGRVIKSAPQEKFNNEIQWFGEAKNRIPGLVPEIYEINRLKNTYEMQRIYGSNLYEWILRARNNQEIVTKTLEKLFGVVNNNIHCDHVPVQLNDIYEMYLKKPRKALEWFSSNIEYFPEKLIVNNHEIINPVHLLPELYSKFESSLKNTTYSFIHGDLTWSNTLIDHECNLYFIDPRGCFGNTKIFGDVRYDIAKLYYSVMGNFDSLNVGRFKYDRKVDRHYYSIDSNGYEFLGNKLLSFFNQKENLIKFIHSTIWLSLLPHVANDKKMLYTVYAHGSYLLNDLSYGPKN